MNVNKIRGVIDHKKRFVDRQSFDYTLNSDFVCKNCKKAFASIFEKNLFLNCNYDLGVDINAIKKSETHTYNNSYVMNAPLSPHFSNSLSQV